MESSHASTYVELLLAEKSKSTVKQSLAINETSLRRLTASAFAGIEDLPDICTFRQNFELDPNKAASCASSLE